MDLVREVLKGVSDTRLLTDHKEGPSPLKDLIKAYSAKAAHNDNAANLTELSVGTDLKDGIEHLECEDQVELMHDYLVKAKKILPTETEAQIEERRIRNLAVRSFIYVTIVVVVLFIGAITAIAVRSGKLPSNEVFGTFLDFAGEIVSLIWEAH